MDMDLDQIFVLDDDQGFATHIRQFLLENLLVKGVDDIFIQTNDELRAVTEFLVVQHQCRIGFDLFFLLREIKWMAIDIRFEAFQDL